MYMLIGAVIFFILSCLFKTSTEFNIMSLIVSVLALALVLQDEEIVDADLIYFVIPLFYAILMSALASATNWKDKS